MRYQYSENGGGFFFNQLFGICTNETNGLVIQEQLLLLKASLAHARMQHRFLSINFAIYFWFLALAYILTVGRLVLVHKSGLRFLFNIIYYVNQTLSNLVGVECLLKQLGENRTNSQQKKDAVLIAYAFHSESKRINNSKAVAASNN